MLLKTITWLALFLTATHCYCPREKIKSTGNCSFHIECYGNIRGVRLRNECLESSNEPVLVDVILKDNEERYDDNIDQELLSLITTLRIDTHSPKTKLPLLQHMIRLENLQLSGNQIETIDDEAFYMLSSLETLDLSYNIISDIEDVFHFDLQPNKLRKLSLAHNNIKHIPEDAFEELTSLIELDLSFNYLSDLTSEPFSNLTSLEVLRLNNNTIVNLNGAVNFLQNLKHLYLRGNKIENIDEESLRIIIHLETFDVSMNQLQNIKPMMFSRHWKHLGGHSICKINLSGNQITSVPNATSKDITVRYTRHIGKTRNIDVLTELDLSKNEISTIEYNAFQSLVKLISLDLSCNKIDHFLVDANDLIFVKYLNLSSNSIQHLYFASFSRMNNLQNLDLSNNKLDYIPDETFHNNNNLKHVNMTFNSIDKVDGLHIHIFHPEGGSLDLSNNGLTQFRISYGEGLRLTDLILRSNNITDPSFIELWHQVDLKKIDLSHNNIRDLNEKSLHLPVSLIYLDLSCNRIQRIGPSSFARIGHLKTLRLSHNHLKTIEYGAFRGLSALLNLDLSFNRIGILDSKLFMDLKSLSILSLRYNSLTLVYDQAWYNHKVVLKVYLDGNNLTCSWLGTALKNYENGYSKFHPAVLEGSFSGHSLDGIPCIPDQSAPLQIEPTVVMADERLLMTSQKILEAVREQTYYLKKYIWRSIQDDAEKSKAFI